MRGRKREKEGWGMRGNCNSSQEINIKLMKCCEEKKGKRGNPYHKRKTKVFGMKHNFITREK